MKTTIRSRLASAAGLLTAAAAPVVSLAPVSATTLLTAVSAVVAASLIGFVCFDYQNKTTRSRTRIARRMTASPQPAADEISSAWTCNTVSA